MTTSVILLWLLAAALAGAWWLNGTRAREHAAVIVARACRDADLQWLDGTVVQKRVEWCRDQRGERCLCRTFVFEYSDDGQSRREGFLRLAGDELEWIGFGPDALETRH